ncbi:phage holin family protein [uncultured Sphingomonas sp.]|uniref:phage holin family protein n=1 Tax=uncultured Sphingomonas sp. TaxID=158754 RepID=UPI002599827C|nr:phage holin family protein [uncultured Sphingomonas sp.]
MAVDGNPETLAVLWEGLSEPVRAAALATSLGVLLAFRNNERGIIKKLLEVVAGGVTGLIIGYILHMAKFEPWVIWSSNVAIAYLGVDKVRQIIDHYVDKYVYKKEI